MSKEWLKYISLSLFPPHEILFLCEPSCVENKVPGFSLLWLVNSAIPSPSIGWWGLYVFAWDGVGCLFFPTCTAMSRGRERKRKREGLGRKQRGWVRKKEIEGSFLSWEWQTDRPEYCQPVNQCFCEKVSSSSLTDRILSSQKVCVCVCERMLVCVSEREGKGLGQLDQRQRGGCTA